MLNNKLLFLSSLFHKGLKMGRFYILNLISLLLENQIGSHLQAFYTLESPWLYLSSFQGLSNAIRKTLLLLLLLVKITFREVA